MRIRKLNKKDIDVVSYLIKRTLHEVNSKDYSKKTIEYLCEHYSPDTIINKSKEGLTIVAIEKKEILGVGNLKENWVSGVFVNPNQHGKGIGKEIINYLEKTAKNNGFEKIRLGSSITAFGFYKRMGYKKIKDIIDKNFGKGILMEKKI